MTPKRDVEAIIENEKEWRRTIYTDVQKIKDEVSGLKVWAYVFRAGGAFLLGALWAYFEKKIGGN